jgi:putative addiction module killer protein
MTEIRRYVTRTGQDVVGDWLAGLNNQTRARITVRVDRLSLGNFGDCKPLREGVSELRIDWGTGISGVLLDREQGMRTAAVRRR